MSDTAVIHLLQSDSQAQSPSRGSASFQSRTGLNAANFFLAEVGGVVMPFLAKFLAERGWRDGAIGTAIALAGLGVWLMQTPAGFIVDCSRHRRMLLAGASLVVGLGYGLLPLLPSGWWVVEPLVFVAGAGHAFFVPLLGALALGLVGHAALNRTVGVNQGWNHAGNIASALTAMLLVGWLGLPSVFYAVTAASILAALSVTLIRPNEVNEVRASGAGNGDENRPGFLGLLHDRRVLILFAAAAMFHLANAPVMPLVGLYIARLGGTDTQVAAVVLVAQTVMIPVALAAGWLCDRWGRKWVFAIGFIVLPLRIFLYSLTSDPWMLVALQSLDGIGAGIYGVVIVAICADLTRGRGGFNSLQGLIATAVSVGGVIGPLAAGLLVQHLGFQTAFYAFAGVAAVAALLFLGFMPETCPRLAAAVEPASFPLHPSANGVANRGANMVEHVVAGRSALTEAAEEALLGRTQNAELGVAESM
jgi:MFS family permease